CGGYDLPGNTDPILEPAARSFLAATLGEARPDFIELTLGLAGRDERERLAEPKGRTAVEGRVLLPVEQEAGVPQATFRERSVPVTAQDADHPGIRKHRNVEVDRLFAAFLEGQTRSNTLHLDGFGNRRRLRIRLRHFSPPFFFGRVLPRRSSSAANLSRRASHIPRYPIIHSSNSRNGSGRNA